MVASLNEMANKLQTFIVEMQSDSHNSSNSNLNLSKYNNLKLLMDETIRFPHLIIRIGISEATYNIQDLVRIDGGLGPDERVVRKWLGNNTVTYELNEIYKNFLNSLSNVNKITGEGSADFTANYSIEYDINGVTKRVYEASVTHSADHKSISDMRKREIKKQLKGFLKSSTRRLN